MYSLIHLFLFWKPPNLRFRSNLLPFGVPLDISRDGSLIASPSNHIEQDLMNSQQHSYKKSSKLSNPLIRLRTSSCTSESTSKTLASTFFLSQGPPSSSLLHLFWLVRIRNQLWKLQQLEDSLVPANYSPYQNFPKNIIQNIWFDIRANN